MDYRTLRLSVIKILSVSILCSSLFFGQVHSASTSSTSTEHEKETKHSCAEMLQAIRNKSNLHLKTNCGLSAASTIEKLTGNATAHENALKILGDTYAPFSSSHVEKSFFSDTEFWGEYGKFNFDKALSKKLYEPSRTAEHLAFYINLYYGGHVFVIEKISNGATTRWKIYQSWETLFTQDEWLGKPGHAWPTQVRDEMLNNIGDLTPEEIQHDLNLLAPLLEPYGNSKLLDHPVDVLNFIEKIVTLVESKYTRDFLPCYIKMYTVPTQA